VWSHKEKENELYNHFQSILGSRMQRLATLNWDDLNMPQLMNHQLDEPFTEDEVKSAIAELPVEKAPHPDGFTGIFYRTCWDMINQDILAEFQCIYNQTVGPLPKLNGALLTLLPKRNFNNNMVILGLSI
jgi:hypothetical protein